MRTEGVSGKKKLRIQKYPDTWWLGPEHAFSSIWFHATALVKGHFRVTLCLFFSFCFFLSVQKRFSNQYSKEYKAKEVSEGEESKDFWNVLGGKANFLSLSGGLYCKILCILVILNTFHGRVIQGFHGSGNVQARKSSLSPGIQFRAKSGKSDIYYIWPSLARELCFLSGKSQGIFKTDVCGNHVIATLFVNEKESSCLRE